MKDDDPEKRIRDLERELGDLRAGGPAPAYDAGFASPARRNRPRWPFLVVVALAVLVPLLVIIAWAVNDTRGTPATLNSGATSAAPITLERGATFSLGGSGSNDTIACNDSYLTLNGNNSTIKVTGHCASLKVGGFNDHVSVDSADVVEVSGYGNTITESDCGKGKLTFQSYGNVLTAGGHCASFTLSAYGNRVQAGSVDAVVAAAYGTRVSVTGHCGKVTVSSYENQVQCDSADIIEAAGYNNTVTYRTGLPKVINSGRGNVVKQG
jgi:Protein of unknown function (DUF3060)